MLWIPTGKNFIWIGKIKNLACRLSGPLGNSSFTWDLIWRGDMKFPVTTALPEAVTWAVMDPISLLKLQSVNWEKNITDSTS